MSDEPNTQQNYQPELSDLQPKAVPKRITIDEEIRRQIKIDIRRMLVEGVPDSVIIREIHTGYDVVYNTAKKYLDAVYADIAKAKAQVGDDKDMDFWMALERYKVALKIAIEKQDVKHIIEANRRIAELQGIIPDTQKGVTINNVMAGGITQVPKEVRNLSNDELASIVDVPFKKIEQQSVDIPEVLTAEEAEKLMAGDD